jgi:serine/threonine protein phosphatase PrpC
VALRIVEHAGVTDVGRQRHRNEDSYLDLAPIFAVADGMGGARAGEVASQLAVEAFKDAEDSGGSPEEQLARIGQEANRRIHELSREDESRAGMGTTLTAAMVTDREVAIGHVGDSRIYRFRDDELERLTDDHSLVEELVRQGKLTSEQAEAHPQKSIITRALGPEPDVEVDTHTYPARDGDVYLLCSDGLTGMLSEDRIAQLLRGRSSLAQAARALVDDANARGGRDNITVVLFRLGSEGEEGEESDTLAGTETQKVDAESVKAAVAEAEGADGSRDEREMTMVMDREAAARARAEGSGGEPASPPGRRRSLATRGHMSRRRRRLAALIVVVAMAAVLAGLYEGSRRFYFLGTDDSGVVTVYRGVPYELPLGAKLYEEEYVSTVPARSLPARQRQRVLDHQLRGRGDAVDLVRQLERGRTLP